MWDKAVESGIDNVSTCLDQYCDKKPKSGLTPIIAQKMVSHCQDEMNKWIEQHGDSTGISGKIDALVIGDAYNADEFTSAIDIELVVVDDSDDEEEDE